MLRRVLADIEALDRELAVYEKRYGMSSQSFYASYTPGAEGQRGARDFVAWSELYIARLERASLQHCLMGRPAA